MNYPTIGEYNQAIKAKGGNAFSSLGGITILPSRTLPIAVYLFGSGAYAAVFKGNYYGQTLALRCFLSAENETIKRAKIICDYLRNLNEPWLVKSEFLENEICVNRSYFPVMKMDWIDGKLINQFVTAYLDDNRVLSELQRKLIHISQSLEENRIGHGDIQCGNIIIKGDSQNFEVKLIDYDGMYVPQLLGKDSIEKGRSEFQRPGRTLSHFDHEMDRFSFWVIITALEALRQNTVATSYARWIQLFG